MAGLSQYAVPLFTFLCVSLIVIVTNPVSVSPDEHSPPPDSFSSLLEKTRRGTGIKLVLEQPLVVLFGGQAAAAYQGEASGIYADIDGNYLLSFQDVLGEVPRSLQPFSGRLFDMTGGRGGGAAVGASEGSSRSRAVWRDDHHGDGTLYMIEENETGEGVYSDMVEFHWKEEEGEQGEWAEGDTCAIDLMKRPSSLHGLAGFRSSLENYQLKMLTVYENRVITLVKVVWDGDDDSEAAGPVPPICRWEIIDHQSQGGGGHHPISITPAAGGAGEGYWYILQKKQGGTTAASAQELWLVAGDNTTVIFFPHDAAEIKAISSTPGGFIAAVTVDHTLQLWVIV
jgi:hypothetical protein